MKGQKTALDYGLGVGILKRGPRNAITDVEGVTVGHCTVDTLEHKTGVTVVIPSQDNMFLNKLVCACHVINGFGKSQGLVQLNELSTLETPIFLTNTLNLGLVHNAAVGYMLDLCSQDGVTLTSVNPIVCECNDNFLNKIAERVVTEKEVLSAIQSADKEFLQGDVGAGKGMSCHGLKGGIGTASRIVELDGKEYTLGMLVMSNYGLLEDLTLNGVKIGKDISEKINYANTVDKGSIIMLIATDIPMSARQLKRINRRAVNGLARLGSITSHESGEIVISFTTANRIKMYSDQEIQSIGLLNEESMDKPFRAVQECCEEAIINSMICANEVTGYNGNTRKSLRDLIEQYHYF